MSFTLLIQGCFEDKPSAQHFKEEMQSTLEGQYAITDIDISAQENTGDSVDPMWKSRFTITYRLTEPLYRQTNSDVIATFVQETQPEGYELTVPYTATSRLNSQSKWTSSIYRGSSSDADALGKPLSHWKGMIVRDGNRSDQSDYEQKVKEYNDNLKRKRELMAESQNTLQDDALTKKTILGGWKDRCNGRGGWAGSMYFHENGKASWNMQGSGNFEGEYSIKDGIISFVWYKNFKKQKPVQWRINFLTEDDLEIERSRLVCTAKREDNENID